MSSVPPLFILFTKTQKRKNQTRVCPPIFQLPLITPPRYPYPRCPKPAFIMSHFAIWGIPFHHLGYPILPFGVSHFTFGMSHFAFWGIPFYLLGYPISPFGVSHFTIWNVPFHLLGYPISPFGVSHFPIWDVPFYLLGYIFGTFAHNVQPDFRFAIFVFAAKYMRFLCQLGKLI